MSKCITSTFMEVGQPRIYKEYYEGKVRHREDGPAIEGFDISGTLLVASWYRNGVLHREDGPAIEDSNGYKAWWINGIQKEVHHTSGVKFIV